MQRAKLGFLASVGLALCLGAGCGDADSQDLARVHVVVGGLNAAVDVVLQAPGVYNFVATGVANINGGAQVNITVVDYSSNVTVSSNTVNLTNSQAGYPDVNDTGSGATNQVQVIAGLNPNVVINFTWDSTAANGDVNIDVNFSNPPNIYTVGASPGPGTAIPNQPVNVTVTAHSTQSYGVVAEFYQGTTGFGPVNLTLQAAGTPDIWYGFINTPPTGGDYLLRGTATITGTSISTRVNKPYTVPSP